MLANVETQEPIRGAGRNYLDYPVSIKSGRAAGGLPGRRPDWDNPFLGEILEPETVQAIEACGHDWEFLTNAETGARKARLVDYCHERLFCGVCSTSEAHRNAARWQEHFRAARSALGLDAVALMFVFTVPAGLSRLIVQREDRRDVFNALFRGVHNVFKTSGLAGWVATVHFVSTNNPDQAHVHFPVFALPVTTTGAVVPGFVDRETFAARRRRFLALWNRELGAVCAKFGLGDWPAENIHLSYLKTVGALAKKLHYEMRPAMQDAFVHGSDSREKTQGAVKLILSLLYPPGSKTAFRRIRGGGAFSPRSMRSFFGGLGMERQDKEDDSGEWVSEGRAFLLGSDRHHATFLIVKTGEIVKLPLDKVSMSSHGCGFEWVQRG